MLNCRYFHCYIRSLHRLNSTYTQRTKRVTSGAQESNSIRLGCSYISGGLMSAKLGSETATSLTEIRPQRSGVDALRSMKQFITGVKITRDVPLLSAIVSYCAGNRVYFLKYERQLYDKLEAAQLLVWSRITKCHIFPARIEINTLIRFVFVFLRFKRFKSCFVVCPFCTALVKPNKCRRLRCFSFAFLLIY